MVRFPFRIKALDHTNIAKMFYTVNVTIYLLIFGGFDICIDRALHHYEVRYIAFHLLAVNTTSEAQKNVFSAGFQFATRNSVLKTFTNVNTETSVTTANTVTNVTSLTTASTVTTVTIVTTAFTVIAATTVTSAITVTTVTTVTTANTFTSVTTVNTFTTVTVTRKSAEMTVRAWY